MSLTRDVLRWMQSLDLSYSVKNVKRDFANGFLIAEIFSRYYKQDVQMHSYDNGSSIEKRNNNWNQLKKFFKKKNFPITDDLITSVIYCQDGQSAVLVKLVYEILTKKKVKEPERYKDDYAPPFSRPTANSLVQKRMQDPDMRARDDRSYQHGEAQRVVDNHNETLRQERTLEPQRFIPSTQRSQNTINRVATRKVSATNGSAPQIEFKGVEVKQVEDNVAQIRAAHSSRGGMGASVTSISQLPVASMGATGAQPAGRGVVKPSVELLNSCVLNKLDGLDVLKRFDPRKDAMVCFVEDLATFPDDIGALIFNDALKKVSHLIAENCLASPKEFWNFFGLCWTAITKLRATSTAFKAVVELIEKVGRLMVEKDQHVPFALLSDFGLPKIIALLQKDPNRPQIIRILYAFCVADVEEHVNVIRKLRDGLDNFDTFVVCLSTLVRLETTFTPKLLDLYLYYAVAGLTHASPAIRAACISILSPIALNQEIQGHKQVISLFDRLEDLAASDPAWQVKSAILMTACSLLKVLPSKDQLCSRLYALVSSLAGANASSLILQTAVVGMSSCLGTHATITTKFMDLVLERPDVVQRALGYCKDGLSVSTVQDNISSIMDRKAVALTIANHVKDTKPDNLAPSHIRLLAKAVEGMSAFPEEDKTEWEDVYLTLRDHLIVELYEPSTCGAAVTVLSRYLDDPSTTIMSTELLETEGNQDPPMYGILRLIFPDGNEVCRQNVASFLGSLAAKDGTDFPQMVYRLVKNFEKLEPDKYTGSELEAVVEKLENE